MSGPTLPPNSRYAGVGTGTIVARDGRHIVYFRRRFVPAPERFATLEEHVVAVAERLDQIAARYFSDPELYWRLCDANRALNPGALTDAPGRRLTIPLPEGFAGRRDE